MRIRKEFKIKKTILLIFTFLTMMGECSCETKNEKEKKKQTDHEVVAEMKGYLYDKYGYIDYDFVVFRHRNNWDMYYDLLLLTTSYGGDDEAEFCVRRFEQDGEYVCADNYVQFLTADELEEEMKEFTSNYFSEFKLYANVGKNDVNVFPMSFKTFDDIKDGYDKISDIIPQNSFLTFRVYVKESSLSGEEEFNTIKEKYKNDLNELGFVSCRYLYYVDDESFDGLE